MTRLAPLPLALCLIAVATNAAARDMNRNNIEDYTIEADILDAPNCTGDAPGQPFENPLKREFEKGLCLYHKADRSADDLGRSLDLLTQAQRQGLPMVQQQLAGFVSGLGHCAEAQGHLATYRASDQTDLLARTRFCKARRMALADLNALRWDFALFDYADGLTAPRTLETRLGEMASCHAGALAPSFDAECGLITAVSDAELTVFVDEAVDGVVETYFSGVESPVTAMFQRKAERAEGVLDKAEGAIDDLSQGAAAVNGEHDAYLAAYEAARDAKMTPIYRDYTQAILRATAILDEYTRWKEGLFYTSENVNLLPKIIERGEELTEELTRVATDAYAERAETLVGDVRAVLQSETENRKLIAQLCRVQFCELTARRRLPGVIRVCRQPEMANNPLCVTQAGVMRSGVMEVDFGGGRQVNVVDLCSAAGVDPLFLTVGLAPDRAQACLEQMP